MEFIHKVPVKQILTENSKEKLTDQFIARKNQLEQECQQLQFEKRKLLNKKGMSETEVKRRFEQEIARRQEKIRMSDYQLDQLDILPLGSEITEGEVDVLVEVEVGAKWEELINKKAIIVKDGIVIQIK